MWSFFVFLSVQNNRKLEIAWLRSKLAETLIQKAFQKKYTATKIKVSEK